MTTISTTNAVAVIEGPQDIRRDAWRICPPCRDGPDLEGTGSHRTPPQTLRNDPAASTITYEQE